jgi:hypothetical protein
MDSRFSIACLFAFVRASFDWMENVKEVVVEWALEENYLLFVFVSSNEKEQKSLKLSLNVQL